MKHSREITIFVLTSAEKSALLNTEKLILNVTVKNSDAGVGNVSAKKQSQFIVRFAVKRLSHTSHLWGIAAVIIIIGNA